MGAREELVEEIATRTAEMLGAAATTKLVDANVVADQLGVPATWVRACVRRGEIPHVRLGHYVRFDPNAVEVWWRQRTRHHDTRRKA